MSSSGAGGGASVQKRAGVPSQLANLQQQLRESSSALLENFSELVKLSDCDNETSILNSLAIVQQEHLEIQARTLAIVRACEKLSEVTAQLKTMLVVNDFSQINASVEEINKQFSTQLKANESKSNDLEQSAIQILNESEFYMQSGHT